MSAADVRAMFPLGSLATTGTGITGRVVGYVHGSDVGVWPVPGVVLRLFGGVEIPAYFNELNRMNPS